MTNYFWIVSSTSIGSNSAPEFEICYYDAFMQTFALAVHSPELELISRQVVVTLWSLAPLLFSYYRVNIFPLFVRIPLMSKISLTPWFCSAREVHLTLQLLLMLWTAELISSRQLVLQKLNSKSVFQLRRNQNRIDVFGFCTLFVRRKSY